MARSRIIKPDFFTSDDIVAITPYARLLYIGLWCEADRMGRLTWSPSTFHRRYLPEDEVQIATVVGELLTRGLVVTYEFGGASYAHIPTFLDHQTPNNRESESKLPEPPRR